MTIQQNGEDFQNVRVISDLQIRNWEAFHISSQRNRVADVIPQAYYSNRNWNLKAFNAKKINRVVEVTNVSSWRTQIPIY